MKSIYIGNLSYSVTTEQLEALFSQYGEVISIKLINDKDSGKPKGYGFVEMEDANADTAIRELNSTNYLSRTIKVSEAKEKYKNTQN